MFKTEISRVRILINEILLIFGCSILRIFGWPFANFLGYLIPTHFRPAMLKDSQKNEGWEFHPLPGVAKCVYVTALWNCIGRNSLLFNERIDLNVNFDFTIIDGYFLYHTGWPVIQGRVFLAPCITLLVRVYSSVHWTSYFLQGGHVYLVGLYYIYF